MFCSHLKHNDKGESSSLDLPVLYTKSCYGILEIIFETAIFYKATISEHAGVEVWGMEGVKKGEEVCRGRR
jgi:hypothetical protein